MNTARALLVPVLSLLVLTLHAQDAPPKVLFDPAEPNATAIAPNDQQGDTTFQLADGGIEVAVRAGGTAGFPGIVVTPQTAWDASGFGRIETRVTNTGPGRLRVSLRVDNSGDWQSDPYSADSVALLPGESKTVSAIFGYRWGTKAFPLRPEALVRAIIFTGKSPQGQSFRVEKLVAAGAAGDKPYVDPRTVAVKPAEGKLFPNEGDLTKQVSAAGGAGVSSSGQTIAASFSAAGQTVTFKPAEGFWNLNEYLEVKVRLRNTGSTPLTPAMNLLSKGGPSNSVTPSTPLMPGEAAEMVLPFKAAKPWEGACLPEMLDAKGPKRSFYEFKPGTGTKFESNRANGLVITADGPGSMEITSVVAGMPPRPPLPDWLGKRPPVEGDWTLTFEDNFDGDSIDLTKWNIYTETEWHLGKDTGFSKDNVIVKDGKLALRVEKRKVHHNDNPAYPLYNYATGWADGYGKWTQRYGYFEARVKLPKAPNAFTAFWLMPDRGLNYARAKQPAYGETRTYQRNSTNGKGMEFDIMEQLSIWGPNRHDFGMHWDHYMENHKTLGTFSCYFQPDEEGFLTVGMLWTPGSVIMFQQGREGARWECSRIGELPSYMILQHITGGWETEGMDDSQLPSDLIFDYVRVWQRADLASDVDGPKPNQGGPLPPTD